MGVGVGGCFYNDILELNLHFVFSINNFMMEQDFMSCAQEKSKLCVSISSKIICNTAIFKYRPR